MASITLAEASKLSLDDLITGVIENIVDINPLYSVLPFQDIDGNAKTYNRENVLGDTQVIGIDGTITAKAAASYTKVTSNLTTIIGDAEVNGLLQAQRVGGDIASYQIQSKAKQVGRHYQHLMFEGDPGSVVQAATTPKFAADADDFQGLRSLVSAVGGDQVLLQNVALSHTALDELLHAVKSKDGQVDAFVMSDREIRKLRALNRALGFGPSEYVMMGDIRMESYAGVPILRSEYIPNDIDNSVSGSNTGGTTTDSVVYALCFDDGSEKVGIAGLTSAQNMGLHVQAVGPAETKDNDIWRIKFYSSFAMYSALSVAMMDNVAA